MTSRWIMLSITVALLLPTSAMAQLSARCTQDDWIMTAAGTQGRNAWSVKCNYISQARADLLNGQAEYQVYSNGCNTFPNVPAGSTCQFYVPMDANAACVSGLLRLGTCMTGCYTPSQRLKFAGQYSGVEAAYESHAQTVTALSKDSTADALKYAEQPIRTYVAGAANEDIWVLERTDGRRLEVTSEHPMVMGDGLVVRAKTLKVNDVLLASDGQRVPLRSVSTYRFVGSVWNVQPKSTDKLENLLDAEGFLTGSIRFQNQWADDTYRLSLRDDASTAALK